MGATASTVQGYNEVRSSRKRGETFIPLFDINEHIRMFQHQTGGDILMLVDKDAVEFLKDSTAGEYQEIFISRRGTEYLDNLSLALSFEATKALQDKVAGRANFTKLQPRVPVGDEVVDEEEEEVEREPTLYQTHLEDNISAYYGSGAKPVVKTSTQVASPKVVKKTASVEGHKNTERDREEPGTPLRSTGSSLGGSASSTSFAHRTELRGVLTFESRSMSMDLENDVVPPLLALGSLSRSVDNNGPVSNVSSLSMSMSYDRESEVTRGSVPTIHTSSTAAANFRKHEQEQLAKLARSNSSATGAAVAPAEDRNAAPKSARSSPSQSQAKADLPPLQSPAQAMATPSPRRSPRGIAAAVTPVSSITSVLTGGGATPGSLTAGTSVAPISGLTSRADSKDFKDSPPSPASPPEATPGPAPTTTPTTASALTATTAPVAAVTTTAPVPVPVSVKMREFVPTAYLPPGQRHRQRIAAEDEADIRKSIIEGSRILSAGSKDELNNISNMTMTYSSMGRGNSSDSKRHQDNKHSDSSEGGVKLSPRAMSFLSATADSKAPSLRAHLNSNSSSSTIHTGLAPHHNGGGSFHQGIADAGPITMGLGCSSSSTRVPGGGGNTSLCPNCGQELRSGNARDSERFDSHVSSCSMRKEMRSVLANIDQVLEPVRSICSIFLFV